MKHRRSNAIYRSALYTDNREALIKAIQERTGQKLTALQMDNIKESTREQFNTIEAETPAPEVKKDSEIQLER